MLDAISLTKQLIACPSITPKDEGCQAILKGLLLEHGFQLQSLDTNGVNNFYSWHGDGAPLFIFCGHTDVVPPGPLEQWKTPPFTPTEKEGVLYGRGAADMKSAVAAMVVAACEFVQQHPRHQGTLALAITGDEEGSATDGTIRIVEYLQQKQLQPDYVLVGEPSSEHRLGDTIKVGRRGSMHGELKIIGKQGHIAYPHLADNAIHRSLKALDALATAEWDKASDDFPATQLQFYDIQAGVGASNVVPGVLKAKFNCRFSPLQTPDSLEQKIEAILGEHGVKYEIDYRRSSLPFFSGDCELARVCQRASQQVCGHTPELSTAGGTSDGRFFAPYCKQIVELGVVNASIHKVDECVKIKEIPQLTHIYQNIIRTLCG